MESGGHCCTLETAFLRRLGVRASQAAGAATPVSVKSRGSLLPRNLEAPGCRGARGSFMGGAAEAKKCPTS